jgi:CRP-like cAMP-binding protein
VSSAEIPFCLASPIFKGVLGDLPEATLSDIARNVIPRKMANGEAVTGRQAPPKGWYGIVQGEVSLVSSTENGDNVGLTVLRAGDWFGETALVSGLADNCDALARGKVDLALLPASVFRRLITQDAAFSACVLAVMARRAQAMVDLVRDLATLPMPVRLAKRLMALSDTRSPEIEQPVRFSQAEYAQLVAARRQSINRELRKWERAGWIDIRYGGIRVLNRDAISGLAAAA